MNAPMPPPPKPSRRVVIGGRLLVIVLFAIWAWQGPTRYRVFKQKKKLSWSYVFFRWQGKSACDIRYYEAKGDELEYIERWKVFGYDTPDDMPRPLRVVGPVELVAPHTAQFCRLLREQRGGEPVDVRAKIRCPNWDNWTDIETGDRNVCEARKTLKGRAR